MKRAAFAVLAVLVGCFSLQWARARTAEGSPPGDGPHAAVSGSRALTPDLAAILNPKVWHLLNGEARLSEEGGTRAVHLSPIGGNRKGSNVALALVEGVDFAEGAIEIDLKGQGEQQASFLGVAFNVVDEKTHEAVYFRPFNFRSEDPVHRGHAVQYVAWPEHTWERLRQESPGVYETTVDPVPDPADWFSARIEVAREQVRVFVNHADRPCLVVKRLATPGKGRVGLWVDSQESAFAHLRILPDPAAAAERRPR